MASSTPNLGAPLNFTVLPVEVQKEIFLKYFEDPCKIRFYSMPFDQGGRSIYKIPHYPNTDDIIVRHRFGPEARIALTNKRFFDQTMGALKNSPHTILEFNQDVEHHDVVLAYMTKHVRALTMHAMTLRTAYLFWPVIEPYVKLAPKLTTIIGIHGPLDHIAHKYRVERVIQSVSLRSLVKGHEHTSLTSKWRDVMEDTARHLSVNTISHAHHFVSPGAPQHTIPTISPYPISP